MSYAKLFGSILDSTIWQEELHVKVVWITMMAMADRDGTVEASIPGLARRANVTIRQAEEALALFLAPDTYSRTKDHEGRRIAELPEGGGWHLLNFEKYRDKLDAEDQRQKAAARQQRRRDRVKGKRDGHAASPNVTVNGDGVTLERDDQRDGHGESRRVRHTDQIRSIGPLSLDLGSPSPELPDPRAAVRADLEPPPPPEDAAPGWLPLEMPDGWTPEPEPELERFAADTGVDVAAELRKLRDRCKAQGTTSVDWQASWRTWLQRAIEWARKAAKPAPSAIGPRHRALPAPDPELRAIREKAEAAARERDEVEAIAKTALAALGGGAS